MCICFRNFPHLLSGGCHQMTGYYAAIQTLHQDLSVSLLCFEQSPSINIFYHWQKCVRSLIYSKVFVIFYCRCVVSYAYDLSTQPTVVFQLWCKGLANRCANSSIAKSSSAKLFLKRTKIKFLGVKTAIQITATKRRGRACAATLLLHVGRAANAHNYGRVLMGDAHVSEQG